jgi:hypothetical protein
MSVQATTGYQGDSYQRLEERILARDQKGASDAYYDLVREGRPLAEMILEAVKIHGPYTHVPYHERIDHGFVNFVNNDHCLLSARATWNLARMVPEDYAALPMAQTIWYIPTGLDIWQQKILKAPGHYARGYEPPPGPPPAPTVYWPDQEPEYLEGALEERLNHWLMLVQRGQVVEAYRVFLGLFEDQANRERVLAELVFAGLIDVQDRMLLNRSYTTGHKSYRARSTVELGRAVGWERAHPVLYAGALDIAVGPRWYSTYEVGCHAVTTYIDGERVQAIPYSGTSEKERALWANAAPLTEGEAERLVNAIIREPEPGYVEVLADLLKAGKSLKHLIDAIQIGSAQVVLETDDANNFSMPQHCFEYCNNLRWFYDNFEHPQRIKLIFLAASFLNRAAQHQVHTSGVRPNKIEVPAGAAKLSPQAILERLEQAQMALDTAASTNWTQAYLDSSAETGPLVAQLALAASKVGNDPHNQEIAQNFLESYGSSASPLKHRLLLACAHHTAGHRKYGNPLDCYDRFAEAFGLPH